jgi:hypothetical protein
MGGIVEVSGGFVADKRKQNRQRNFWSDHLTRLRD